MASPDPETSGVRALEPRYLGLGELFYQIQDAVVVGDARTGRVILWNEAASRIFGYSADEARDLLIEDLVPEALKEAHRSGLRRFADSGHGSLIDSGSVVELPAVRKDGGRVVVELRLTPLENDRLAGRFAMAIIRDVTERKAAGEQLRKLGEIKDLFMATVAHDIRSPMSAVGGFAQLLLDDWNRFTDDERRRMLEAVARSASNVMRLVENVLQAATLDTDELPLTKQVVDLARSIGDAVDEVRAAHPSIVFDVRVDRSAPAVRADPVRLWQILVNLLSNAVKFSAAGGRVTVAARELPGMMEVRVRDDGPGIRREDQAKLFQKFSRITHPSDSLERRGTGLGLYICRAIVEGHGGRIWVESTPGEGATFFFTLPLAD